MFLKSLSFVFVLFSQNVIATCVDLTNYYYCQGDPHAQRFTQMENNGSHVYSIGRIAISLGGKNVGQWIIHPPKAYVADGNDDNGKTTTCNAETMRIVNYHEGWYVIQDHSIATDGERLHYRMYITQDPNTSLDTPLSDFYPLYDQVCQVWDPKEMEKEPADAGAQL